MRTNKPTSKQNGGGQPSPASQQAGGLSPQTKQAPNLLSRAEVAQRLGTCTHTVQRLTRRGLLPAIRFNARLIRYAPETLEAFINSAVAEGGEP